MTREAALATAAAHFDSNAFRDRLAELVAIPSSSQDPERKPDVQRYLGAAIQPWLESLGFAVAIHANPVEGSGPILVATRIEDASLPTILTYGHGDTVRGLEDQWDAGLNPWVLTEIGDLWYGRGTADNKGQHATVITALEIVLKTRGRLGFNIKMLLEMSEERGSVGLRQFVQENAALLAADALIASDGPRVTPTTPTITSGSRGAYRFDLVLRERPGGVHSGNWGGMTNDPAIVLAHAIASIADRNGRILVRALVPPHGISNAVRDVLSGLELQSEASATINPNWGEPGLSAAEKVYGWTSFIVLAMLSGRPEAPVNAVAPDARAVCQLRYTVDCDPATFEAALRHHLDEAGFPEIAIENTGTGGFGASRTDPTNPWVQRTKASMERTLGKHVQIIPNGGGGLPGDMMVEFLGVPLVWIPLSYNGCKQHGPNEHFLKPAAREGVLAYTGIWWDLGDL